jgi:predicted transcriptional regulator
MAQVLEITGKKKSLFRQTIHGKQGNSVRAVAAWWLIHGAGLTNVQTGEILKMTPVAVSKALARIQSQIDRDRTCETAQWIRELRSRFEGQ